MSRNTIIVTCILYFLLGKILGHAFPRNFWKMMQFKGIKVGKKICENNKCMAVLFRESALYFAVDSIEMYVM